MIQFGPRRRGGTQRRAARQRPPSYETNALLLALLLLAPIGAGAETAYVSDRLLLGVHETKSLNSAIIKLLPSGTQLEVLERDQSLARVRSREGYEGWVDSSYLGTEEPSSLVADKLRRLIADGTREMERARQIIGELEAEVAGLKVRADQAESALDTARKSAGAEASPPADASAAAQARAEIERVSKENDALKQSLSTLEAKLAAAASDTMADARESRPTTPQDPLAYLVWLAGLPWTWVAIGAGVTLAFAAGVWLADWKQRRRHGGFRV